MKTKSQQTRSSNYRSMSAKNETIERVHEIHRRLAGKFSFNGFLCDMLDTYEKCFCPECGSKIKPTGKCVDCDNSLTDKF
jgi:hypothetical protein